MNGTGSNGWAAVGKPKADCGGSSPVEVRCDGSSDSDGGQNTQSLHERLGSGGDWEGDLDGGGHASHNDVEAAELAARQEPSWFTLPSNCRGMTPVAFMCLILVVSAYTLESGSLGVTSTARRTVGRTMLARAQHAQAHAKHQGLELVARVTGGRHCRPPLDPLLPRSRRPKVHVMSTSGFQAMAEPRDERGQVLAPARRDGLLTMMTPVFPDNETLALLHNQLRSANTFVNMDTMQEWVFVAPREHMGTLVAFLEGVLETLPCIPAAKVRVVEDEACAPEVEPDRLAAIANRTDWKRMNWFVNGWTKQQLIKLACSFTVETPWFLILDADTFFLSPLEALDLMQQKACTPHSVVCDLKRQVQFRARNEMTQSVEEDQFAWISSSARTLHMPVVRDLYSRTVGVTPQILSTAIISSMANYIGEQLTGKGESWREFLLHTTFEASARKVTAWTEYDLYWEYARNQSLWTKYHMHTMLQKVAANIWTPEQVEHWAPCDHAGATHSGYWAVVQSTVKMSGADIWKRLKPCMDSVETVDDGADDSGGIAGAGRSERR